MKKNVPLKGEATRRLKALRLAQIFLGVNNIVVGCVFLFIMPHTMMHDQTYQLLGCAFLGFTPIEMIILEIVIRRRTRQILMEAGQGFESNKL